MQRVLIIVANREQFPEPAFPCGALYVAGAVEAAGGRARVFDAGLYRRPLAALRAELREWQPDDGRALAAQRRQRRVAAHQRLHGLVRAGRGRRA